jgi:hypothetical protein
MHCMKSLFQNVAQVLRTELSGCWCVTAVGRGTAELGVSHRRINSSDTLIDILNTFLSLIIGLCILLRVYQSISYPILSTSRNNATPYPVY